MHFTDLSIRQKQKLLQLARRSINHGARTGKPPRISLQEIDAAFVDPGCSFVTLHKEGNLRGCVGALTPSRSLALDIVEHAYSAAFCDHRFQPVSVDEIASLHIEISILTPQTRILCRSEEELLGRLRPFQDGVTLKEGSRQATFLPAVWEKLPDKRLFLRELKHKAGLPEDYWTATIEMFRYHTISFAE